MNKPLGVNPKDLLAAKKCDLSVFPAIGIYHGAHAMVDGALKYGPYNWRDKAVLARVYIAAAKRHIARWEAGEEYALEGTHNLGNVIACCALLLDAQATGNLGDDRAKSPELLRIMDEVDAKCKALGEAAKAKAAPAAAPRHDCSKGDRCECDHSSPGTLSCPHYMAPVLCAICGEVGPCADCAASSAR